LDENNKESQNKMIKNKQNQHQDLPRKPNAGKIMDDTEHNPL